MSNIDEVSLKLGQTDARIISLENEVAALRGDVTKLLEIANKGSGAWWITLSFGGFMAVIVDIAVRFLGVFKHVP